MVIHSGNLKSMSFLCALILVGCTTPPVSFTAPEPTPTLTRWDSIPGSAVKILPNQDHYPPILHIDSWEKPVPVNGAVNTSGAEDSPFITPDGSTLYYFFTPDASIPAEKQVMDGVTGIYSASLQNDSWMFEKRILLQDPGKLALDGCEFIQGSVIWFCSAREGYTGVNLFTAQFFDGKWKDWKPAGEPFHQYEVGEMHITADGKELYFHSMRSGGKGQLDIWVIRQTDLGWETPENVAVINSPESEGWPFVTQDGLELWFTRFYLGSPAIFRSVKTNGQWSEPELILSQFAGEPSLDDAGNIYFVHHYEDSVMLEADIYVAYKRK
jgi:hypothetical protein